MDENTARQLAFFNSQVTCAMITAMGMQAENEQRKIEGKSIAYDAEAFQQVILDHNIAYNQAVEGALRAGW